MSDHLPQKGLKGVSFKEICFDKGKLRENKLNSKQRLYLFLKLLIIFRQRDFSLYAKLFQVGAEFTGVWTTTKIGCTEGSDFQPYRL